jgi:hypothetical protein
LYFGTNDGPGPDPGADGIVFVLQNQGPETVGRVGGGLGYSGIKPSLAVELDTYQNSIDPPEDHITLLRDGSLATGVLDGPIPLPFNLEDGTWHNVTFVWLSDSMTIKVLVNDTLYLDASPVDLTGILGSSFAYLGFTSSTGTSSNVQEVCINSIRGTVYMSSAPSLAPSGSTMPSAEPSLAPSRSSQPSSEPSSGKGAKGGKGGQKVGKADKGGNGGKGCRKSGKGVRALEDKKTGKDKKDKGDKSSAKGDEKADKKDDKKNDKKDDKEPKYDECEGDDDDDDDGSINDDIALSTSDGEGAFRSSTLTAPSAAVVSLPSVFCAFAGLLAFLAL